MPSHLINFDEISWNKPFDGLRFKPFIAGNQKIRLWEISEGFFEDDWCRNGHIGYVIEGSFSIDYCGNIEYYKAGDFFHIPAGESDKHKAIPGDKGKSLIILFEEV
jgi:quercetin dioxygenase-like cupin family protein